MKTILFSILAIIVTLNCNGQITSAFKFIIQTDDLRDSVCSDNQTYKLFNIEADNKEMTSGMPELPVFYYRFIMPNGYVIDSITYIEADTSSITLNHKLFPAQPAVAACIGCPSPVFKTPDSLVYSSTQPYPIRRTLIAGSGIWHTANILTIGIYPYQYFPLTNKLSYAGRITTSIYYHINNGATQQTKKMLVAEYNNFINDLQSMIENPYDVSVFLSGIEIINQLPVIDNFPIYQYVVIAHESFIGSEPLNRFVEWKKKKGLNIGVISLTDLYNYCDQNNLSTDDIGNTSTNFPNNNSITGNAAKIRKYLQKMNNNGGCNNVLLLGDDTKVPVRKYYAYHDYDGHDYEEIYAPTEVITDKYYADFTSDYNVDGDDNLGEYNGDMVDKIPECYVGRIPCTTIEELGIWVNKALNYETDPGIGSTDFLGNFTLTMADEMQAELQNNTLLFNNLNIFTLRNFKETPNYNSPNPVNPDGSDIINSLKSNPTGWWTWSNHGDPDKFLTMTYGENISGKSNINYSSGANGLLSLNNTNKYGIIHSASCSVAYFPRADCILRSALFNSNGGFVSFSGNTDMGWVGPEDSRLISLTQDIKSCHNGNDLNLTKICPLDWRWIISCAMTESSYESYLTHNLFGDPEMMYYTKQPVRIDADLSSQHIDASVNDIYQVTIKNLPNGRHANVCLYKPADGLYPEYQVTKEVIAINHQSCVASFDITANNLTPGKMFVTVTSFDMMPFMDEILVSPGCSKSANAEEISVNTTYPVGNPIFKDHDVIINSGATLTIQGEVYFVADAKIVVKPNGKLIIDGGLAGASCENFWQGVEVWGNTYLPQTVINQGMVSVYNGGKINDAVCAIRTAKMNGITTDPTTYGGIIRCNNASFINNKCAIRIYPYNQGAYNATINETNFLTNDHYMINIAPLPLEMFSIDGITGLNISKCTFNYSADFEDIDKSNRGTGLLLTNSSVSLGNTDNTGSSFSNLTYGIKGTNTGGVCTPYIRNCIFENNLRGIYLSAYSGATINKNMFKTLSADITYPSSGLYLNNNCTGYSVQENTFEGHYTGNNTYETGILINNSGTAPNEIYNNTFTKLQNGILAQNKNRDATGLNGLVIKCNDFTPNLKYDIAITKNETGVLGVKAIQGTDGQLTTDPAGNTFSYTHQNSESDYHNECENITYIYHFNTSGFRIIPTYISSSSIFPNSTSNPSITYTKSGSCPSLLNNGGGISQLKSQQEGMETNISNFTGQLLTLKDGGNTAELEEDIAYSIPPEALALFNSLLTKSPYLSDSVMIEAVGKEDVLPSAMVTDILVANPQSAKSSEVNEALDNRTNLLSDEQREDVDQGVFVLSAFETLQSRLSDALAKRAQLQYAIVNHYLCDSTGTDSLKIYLAAQPDLWAKQLLLLQYMAEMDSIAADALLQTIPITSLNPSQQAEWNDLAEYYGLCRQIAANENSLPDSLQLITLTELASHNSAAGTYARNLLINQGAMVYHEPYIFPDENLKSGKVIRRKQLTNESNFQFKLYPNPASMYVIVEYELGQALSSPLITITDELGQLIRGISPSGVSGFQVISLSDIAPGVYLVRFSSGSKILKESKLVVVS